MNIIQIISLAMIIIIFFSLFCYKGSVIKEGFEIVPNYDIKRLPKANPVLTPSQGEETPPQPSQAFATVGQVEEAHRQLKEYITKLRSSYMELEKQLNTQRTYNYQKFKNIKRENDDNRERFQRINVFTQNTHEKFVKNHNKRENIYNVLNAKLENQQNDIRILKHQMREIVSKLELT